MAFADKCHLQIPFPEWAKSLVPDRDGKINADVVTRAAEQEFENLKAIERRINNPDCQGEGGCCTWGFNGNGGTEDLADGTGTVVTVDASDVVDFIYPTETGPTELPGGMWHVTGEAIFTFSGATSIGALNDVAVTVNGDPGGKIRGHAFAFGGTKLVCPFSGVLWQTATSWVPSVAVSNGAGQNASFVEVNYFAMGSCPCDTSLSPGGG
jgi:hypothetical protein